MNLFINHYSRLHERSSLSRYDYLENFYDGLALVRYDYNDPCLLDYFGSIVVPDFEENVYKRVLGKR